jgi:predicted Zn-dependent protease
MPGGDIVVFSGIVKGMEHPEQLAALLAHEATHVHERHSTRMMVRQMAGYLFLSLLIGDVNAVVGVLAENADNLRNMSYSRNLETDADARGIERLRAAGVDPQGMVKLLELLGVRSWRHARGAQLPQQSPTHRGAYCQGQGSSW